MREYDSAFFWLEDAKLANICYNTTAPNIGPYLINDNVIDFFVLDPTMNIM